MSKCEIFLPRESYPVGGFNNKYIMTHRLLFCLDAHGFKRFLRVTWEPFEAHFQSIEARFIHHTDIVVRLAGAEQQIHFYKDKQRQEGK